jgi:hypothetical protein
MRTSLRLFPTLALAACAVGGAGTPATPEPEVTAATPPPVRVPEDRPFAITANTRGDIVVEVTAGTPRGRRDTTGAFGRAIELQEVGAGDERTKACGREWRQSEARASGSVVPRRGEGAGVTELTVAVATSARRGFYREKGVLTCTQRVESPASASARARFRTAIALSAGEGVKDRLMIQVSGQPYSRLGITLADSTGAQLPLAPAPGGGAMAELPGAGAYQLSGTLTASAEPGRQANAESSRRATVRLHSLRDALTAAFQASPTPDLLVPFDVPLDARELSAGFSRSVLGEAQAWRPCPDKTACGGRGEELLVTGVRVRPASGGVHVVVGIQGRRGRADTVAYLGDFQGERDSLRLVSLALSGSSLDRRDLAAVGAVLLGRLGLARADAGTPLRISAAELVGRFPVPWGGACVGRGDGVFFRGLRPPTDPELFVAAYGMPIESAVACPAGAGRR